MKKSILVLFVLAMACNQSPKQPTPESRPQEPAMATEEKPELKKLSENKFDPVCGMPVTAGVSDTATYKNHILGFCSPDCKAAFVANPKEFNASSEDLPGAGK